jgi:hypothetical protein
MNELFKTVFCSLLFLPPSIKRAAVTVDYHSRSLGCAYGSTNFTIQVKRDICIILY